MTDATTHDVPGHDVFHHGSFHKAGQHVDFYFAGLHIRSINHATHVITVISVTVSVGHHDNRFFTAVLIIQAHAYFSGFCRDRQVNDGDPPFTLNNCRIGEIGVADLVDPVSHFKRATDVNQLRLAPQARIHHF